MYFWGTWIDIYGNEGRGVMKGYLKYIDHYFSHDEMAENDFGIVVSILSYTVLLDKFEGELERFVLETKRS